MSRAVRARGVDAGAKLDMGALREDEAAARRARARARARGGGDF